jgi:hypothetical protein
MTEPDQGSAPTTVFDGLVVGRIVHYTPTDVEASMFGESNAGPYAAQVAKVTEELGVVHLAITLPTDAFFPTTHKTKMNVPFDPIGAPGTWRWMFEGQGTRYRSDPPAALPEGKPAVGGVGDPTAKVPPPNKEVKS